MTRRGQDSPDLDLPERYVTKMVTASRLAVVHFVAGPPERASSVLTHAQIDGPSRRMMVTHLVVMSATLGVPSLWRVAYLRCNLTASLRDAAERAVGRDSLLPAPRVRDETRERFLLWGLLAALRLDLTADGGDDQ